MNKANPTALILSGVLMLRHLGEQEAAVRVETALREVIAEGTADDLRPGRHPRARGRSPTPSSRGSADGRTAAADADPQPRAGRHGGSMLLRYRGSEGMLAWAFHRISGVAIWAFILLHVLDIWLASVNPALYDELLQVYASPVGRVMESLLGRRAPVPRPQRPADHHHGLLALDDPLPPAAVVRELGRVRRSSGSRSSSRSWRRPSGSRRPQVRVMTTSRYSRSGRARPSGGGWELAIWYLMRLTGLGLFVLALAHYIIVHFLFDPADQTAAVDPRRALGQRRLADRRLADAQLRRVPRVHGHAHGRPGLHEAAGSAPCSPCCSTSRRSSCSRWARSP